MSVTKEIQATARASKIVIDNRDPENISIGINYEDETKFLKAMSVPLSQVVTDGALNSEEVATIDTLIEKLADFYNPYNT